MGIEKILDRECNCFVMSASHDKSESREEADEVIIKQARKYIKKKSPFVSFKFRRAKNDQVDENKFLIPLNGVPVLAFQMINALASQVNVAVVGSEEVGLVVKKMKECFPEYSSRLAFAPEGDSLSLANSIKQGIAAARNSFGMCRGDFFYFVPLDLPFFYNIHDLLHDRDIHRYGCILDLNSREVVFDGNTPELFVRNYWFNLESKDGSVVHFKEPNVYGFSQDLDFRVVDEFYRTRNSGDLRFKDIIRMVMPNIIQDMKIDYKRVLHAIGLLLAQSLKSGLYKIGRRDSIRFTKDFMESVGYYIFNSPLLIKAEHKDPFRIRDIDAWQDLWYYRFILEKAKKQNPDSRFNGLETIYPHAEKIEQFSQAMRDIKGRIGLLSVDFAKYVNERYKALSILLTCDELRVPFTSSGRFIDDPAFGDRIEDSVEVLRQQSAVYSVNSKAEKVGLYIQSH